MPLLSVADATAQVLATAGSLATEIVPLGQAAGRRLAQSLLADRDLPPFDRVAMDGVALSHAAWVAGHFSFVVEHVQYAGAPSMPLPHPLAAVEVMTGAVLPPGADTVVRYEDLRLNHGLATPTIPPPAAPGLNVHHQAADRRCGDLLLTPGTCLGPAEIAVAATVGAATLRVQRAARVAVVSTGDELVDVAEMPLPHQIRRSNAYAVQALLHQAGAQVTLHHLPDAYDRLRRGLEELLAGPYDALVLSGAVSKGRADHLPGLLQALGVQQIFHEVAQRPGKPMWFGQLPGGPVVFGLPGNPVSTLLGAYRYVRPWLRACQGEALGPTPAALAAPVLFRPALTHFLPVRLSVDAEGRRWAMPACVAGSGDLAGLLGADGFLELPAEETIFAVGQVCQSWAF